MRNFLGSGLPLHPLIVHCTVVLLPLTALAVVLYALWPAARRRLSGLTPFAAAACLVLVPLTVASGHALADVVGINPAIARHEHLAGFMLPWTIALAVAAVAQWWWFRFALGSWPWTRRVWATVLAAVLALVPAAGTMVMVVLVGEAGARAAWGGVG